MERDFKMTFCSFNKIVLSTIVIVAFIQSGPAWSQKDPVSIKMGVVNLDAITRQSSMSKDIARQIDAKRKKFRDEIKQEEEVLRKANDELQKQRVILVLTAQPHPCMRAAWCPLCCCVFCSKPDTSPSS